MMTEIVEGYREIKRRFVKAARYAKKVDFNIKQIDNEMQESTSSSEAGSEEYDYDEKGGSSASHVFSEA